jgi:hypothetical protein
MGDLDVSSTGGTLPSNSSGLLMWAISSDVFFLNIHDESTHI